MTEKFIDLAPQIASMHDQPLGTMRVALGLLDEFASDHPDQVPGRTTTESNLIKAVGDPAHDDLAAGFFAGFRHGGGQITPEPKPTNAEKLEKIVWDSDGPIGSISLDRASRLAAWLDEHGVKAPGGDDEH